jgi:hypothetical protein
MEPLNTQTIKSIFEHTTPPFQGGGAWKIEIPQAMITIPKPVSYEFRVAEHLDSIGIVTRVGLQVRVLEHDNYGAAFVRHDWKDVERVKIYDVTP